MRLAVARQREPQRLLGAGLADRAGDADEFCRAARARRARQRAQALEHVGHDQQRRVVRQHAALVRGDDREPAAGLQRRLDEIMAVADVLEREERLARPIVRVSIDSPGTLGRQRALRAPRPSPSPSPRRSTADARSCDLLPKRRRDRLVVAERQRPVADDLAGFMALAGDQQHVARLQRRRPRCGSPRGGRRSRQFGARAPLRGSRRGSPPGSRCADCRR